MANRINTRIKSITLTMVAVGPLHVVGPTNYHCAPSFLLYLNYLASALCSCLGQSIEAIEPTYMHCVKPNDNTLREDHFCTQQEAMMNLACLCLQWAATSSTAIGKSSLFTLEKLLVWVLEFTHTQDKSLFKVLCQKSPISVNSQLDKQMIQLGVVQAT